MGSSSFKKPPHVILGVSPGTDPISLLTAYHDAREKLKPRENGLLDEVTARRLQRLEDAFAILLAESGYSYNPESAVVAPLRRVQAAPMAPARKFSASEKLALRIRTSQHFNACSAYAAFCRNAEAEVGTLMREKGHGIGYKLKAMAGFRDALAVERAADYLRYPSPSLYFDNPATLLRHATAWRDAAHNGDYQAIDTKKLAADETELALHQAKKAAAIAVISRNQGRAPG